MVTCQRQIDVNGDNGRGSDQPVLMPCPLFLAYDSRQLTPPFEKGRYASECSSQRMAVKGFIQKEHPPVSGLAGVR